MAFQSSILHRTALFTAEFCLNAHTFIHSSDVLLMTHVKLCNQDPRQTME